MLRSWIRDAMTSAGGGEKEKMHKLLFFSAAENMG